MPHKATAAIPQSAAFRPEVFLRSINLSFDTDFPDRIDHFHPTAKTASLAKALLDSTGRAAYFVVAPYGSGKSITASYVLQLVENRPVAQEMLERVEGRLQEVSPDFAARAARRRAAKQRGLVLALHGHCASLPAALREAALAALARQNLGREARLIRQAKTTSMEDAFALLNLLQEKAAAKNDRILILWDEFGRHVESLIAGARAAELDDIQLLAEYVARSSTLPMTLGLLLHQDLLRYAGNLPQSLRAEWKKIEGRFQTLQFVDDSKEIYRLIGEIVSSRRNGSRIDAKVARAAAAQAKRVGFFPDLAPSELSEVLERAYPLEPATLYLLPRLSARVAQNERTLFSFLFSADLGSPIGPEHLYDYFAGEMHADIAAGGTFRQFVETESALTKVKTEDQARTLKAACLLGLGLSGERARASREALAYASRGYESSRSADPLQPLINQKLLLYRRHADQVAVWHGTDVDLRGRLEEEISRRSASFDLLDFLARHVPPPVWRPLRYNDDFQIRRYLAGEYCHSSNVEEYLGKKLSRDRLPFGCDGKVIYVLPEDGEDLDALEQKIRRRLQHAQILVVLPRKELNLEGVALELWCLLHLKSDTHLTGSDPLLEAELDQMSDDVREHLHRLVDRFHQPSQGDTVWFYRGRELDIQGVRDLRIHLSRIIEHVFPLTPRLNNELIVKNRPSSVIVNARKRLILGILERTHDDEFGLVGNGPDKSMYYTLLIHTSLFRVEDGDFWARPRDLGHDPGLKKVWEKLHDFLTTPSSQPKPVDALIGELQSPPIGLRQGVMPILFAAALKAFPSIRALLRDGEYVQDILASDIEALCERPQDHLLLVHEIGASEENYLHGLLRLFDSAPAESSVDLMRQCYDALVAWRENLPPGALTTQDLSPAGMAFQRALKNPANPLELFFHRLPSALEISITDTKASLAAIGAARDELRSVEDRYQDAAAVAVQAVLDGGGSPRPDLRTVIARWTACFPEAFVDSLDSTEAKGLLTRLCTPYDSDAALLGSLSSLLLGRGFKRWDDSTMLQFEQKLRVVVQQIEATAVHYQSTAGEQQQVAGLTALLVGRLQGQVDQLLRLVGADEARAIVARILDERRLRKDFDGDA